jgi:hypothetical protein
MPYEDAQQNNLLMQHQALHSRLSFGAAHLGMMANKNNPSVSHMDDSKPSNILSTSVQAQPLQNNLRMQHLQNPEITPRITTAHVNPSHPYLPDI